MTFKEQVEADRSVFLNFDEFGEYHRIEGKQVLCIVDNDKLAEASLNQKLKGQILELVEADLLVIAKEEDLPKNLSEGNNLRFDNKEMIIRYSSVSMGIVEVALAQNRTY